ncbi:MAG: threonine/serine exporter family protein [Alkaliphilus sp.]
MKKEEVRGVIEIALFAGRIMLENGAETSRVEDTINRICNSRGLEIQNFTIPTGIFLSCQYNNDYYPYVIRTKSMAIDLEIIVEVNDFSRKFVNTNMSIEEAEKSLEIIKKTPHFHPLIMSFFGGIAGSFITLSIGGRLIEAIFAFITSFFVVTLVKYLSKFSGPFLKNVAGGMINTVIALLLIHASSNFDNNIELSNIVIGSIMPLVPGVAMTNALRDSISGDFISGASKLSEAMLIAVAIAIGVGFVLHAKILLTGSI